MPTGKQHFLVLDGLRGVAAISVLWGHILIFANQWRPASFELAVDFFYILSGFVVAHAYKARLAQGMSWGKFAKLRLVRLYPLMLVGSLLGAGVMAVHLLVRPDMEWWRLWASAGLSLFALPSFFVPLWPLAFPMNSPSWSLSFEFVANFMYGAVGARLSRTALIALTLLSASALVATVYYFGTMDIGFEKATLAGGFARVAFGFLCGLAIHSLPRMRRVHPIVGVMIAAVLAAILVEPTSQPLALKLALAIVAFPIMIWAAASIQPGKWMGRACTFLGEISYPLYILHYPIVRVLNEASQRFDPEGRWIWPTIAGEMLVCILASYLALKLYDEPLRRWLSKPREKAGKAVASADARV